MKSKDGDALISYVLTRLGLDHVKNHALQLSLVTPVSTGTWHKISDGEPVVQATLEKIATACNVTVQELLEACPYPVKDKRQVTTPHNARTGHNNAAIKALAVEVDDCKASIRACSDAVSSLATIVHNKLIVGG